MRHLSLACALVIGLAVGTGSVVPDSADAAARVSVSNEFGNAAADIEHGTTLNLRGSGFLANQGGFGGIYVFFGIRQGGEYLYIPDAESKNNAGFQRFLSHPGNTQTGSAAHGTINADGTWQTTLNVPGATFQTTNRSGQVVNVDCRTQTCGVITIGAHGVNEPRNETFTPVNFSDIYGDSGPSSSGSGGDGPASSDDASPENSDETATEEEEDEEESERQGIVIDLDTAVAGRVLSFTSDTFDAGEQVIATLDDGISAAGPFMVGQDGLMAGLLDLPVDLSAGTHTLRLTGASTQRELETTFPVKASDDAVPVAAETGSTPEWLPYLFLSLTAGVFLLTLVFAIVRIRRSRRTTDAVPEGG